MNVKQFKRNFILHYLQPVYLYLPQFNKKNNYKISIRPISYVQSGNKQMGPSSDFTYQYFYVDYKMPKTTGTLQLETEIDGVKKHIPQSPCKYRIYIYNNDIQKYVPIKTNGEIDLECSNNSLYENEQTFTLIQNEKYYYREEQAPEGDLLHKELEAFGIDDNGDIILYDEKIDTKLFNRVEKDIEIDNATGKKRNILKIRHYPKLVKAYVTFGYAKETSTSVKQSGYADFTTYFTFSCSLQEEVYNALADGTPWGDGDSSIAPASVYRVFPKNIKISYMEKELTTLKPFSKPIKNDTKISVNVLSKLDKAVSHENVSGVFGQANYYTVTYPDSCANDWYLGDILLHRGEEIVWWDTGEPAGINDCDYGHYFRLPSPNKSDFYFSYIYGSGVYYDVYVIRYHSSNQWVHLISSKYSYEDGVDDKGDKIYNIRYKAPFEVLELTTISRDLNIQQSIDKNYTSNFDKPLIRVKINAPQVKTKYIREYPLWPIAPSYAHDKIESWEKIHREQGYGYGWAGIEDVLGMACWIMGKVTQYDPDGNPQEPYIQKCCSPGQPLYIAWGQYENSNTNDFTKDTLSLSQSYPINNPLLPYESPIKRKAEATKNDKNYPIYNEDQFNFIQQNCDQGCSIVVSYIKTTRKKYFSFICETDPSNNINWLIRE